ncbi:hypothetical protein J2T12_002187 [Paenibacillus anaericanus]|nr:hypothetical protein [Paenibacillus anaericanus]
MRNDFLRIDVPSFYLHSESIYIHIINHINYYILTYFINKLLSRVTPTMSRLNSTSFSSFIVYSPAIPSKQSKDEYLPYIITALHKLKINWNDTKER